MIGMHGIMCTSNFAKDPNYRTLPKSPRFIPFFGLWGDSNIVYNLLFCGSGVAQNWRNLGLVGGWIVMSEEGSPRPPPTPPLPTQAQPPPQPQAAQQLAVEEAG